MPCYEPRTSEREIELSKVLSLLKEINEGIAPDPRSYGKIDVYENFSQQQRDKLYAELCAKLKKVDVKKYSLEMQIWWREHQKFDKERDLEGG